MTLYAWGANSYGQLGLGHKSEEEVSPREVPLKGSELRAEDIVSIAGGAGHTLILSSTGLVYCCGWNSKGQLGLSDDTLKLTQIEILKEFKIVEISCGWDFSAAVSECGKQFVWGNNQHTQLGLSKSITCTGIPSRLQVSQKLATGFKKVSCGLRHSAIITKEGGLLVAGTGAKGQLGLGDNFDDNNYLSITRVPDLEDVISVASGQHHTLALRENGTILSWGENKFGQLGVDPNVANSFIPLEVFHHDGLESVYAGWTHSAALTKNGEVFTWGRDTYGQLGSERDVPYKPEKIPTLSNIRQLSVGSEHNLAVSRDNKLYAWGWNEHGSCGTGDKKDVRIPIQILKNKTVRCAYACTGSSFAVIE
ncbi:secretion-regulating guanine nucleotide exchange factor-like [Anthonomus grandis grandis]|uniref:secretion-regulating guanine nucleotide exchange factor-like n=1 Tax=Anthonomus grandis grandis TaxID=2921223 RepID=UPI0021654380|nr:secretion-regulating guanine nucleotide exchange factor-like [Anthonomus grandis grandis]